MNNKKLIHIIWWIVSVGLLISSITTFIVSPEYFVFNLIVLFLSLIIGLFLIRESKSGIIKFFKSHYFKNLSSNLITISIVLAIIFLINYLGFKNNIYFDLTSKSLHTLSEQSQQIISQVNKPMKMTLFAKRADWDHYLSFLKKYAIINKHIQLSAIDIDTEPALVKLNEIKEAGTVLIEYNDKRVSVSANSELKVTNKLLKIIRDRKIIISYTTGHGELNPKEEADNSSKFLFDHIKDSNYDLFSIDLLKTTEIPKETNAVLVLAPTKGFLDSEILQLKLYLENGGNLIISLGPELKIEKLSNLYAFLLNNGVRFQNSIVIDRLASVQGANATIPIITDYDKEHSITKNFTGRTLFPLSSALLEVPSEDRNFTSLAKTTLFPASWAEVNIDDVLKGTAKYDEQDIKGPVDLAVAVYNKKTNSKMVVFGSRSFISDAYKSQNTNFNLFLNGLAWAIDDEGIISITRPGLDSERILISMSQDLLILFFLMVCSPTIFFALGVYMYRRRRNK